MDTASRHPQFGVALQYNPKITSWFPFFEEPLDALEVLLDSFMGALDGPSLVRPAAAGELQQLRDRFPLLGHSNYGGDFGFEPLDESAAMRRHVPLARRLSCPWVTDHCFYNDHSWSDVWSSPVQFSVEEVDRLAERARRLQRAYGVPLGHENAAYYRTCPGTTMSEGDFLAALVDRAGTFLHLDLHNLFTNETNHRASGYSAAKFLDTIPLERVIVIHLAGGRWVNTFYHDYHDTAVPEPVWDLLDEVLARSAPGAVVLEYESELLHAGDALVTREATIEIMRSDLARARDAWDRAYGPGSRITTRMREAAAVAHS
jgi:uncharacterized protein (UPF0276 family)